MASQLETAVEILISVFYKYSSKEGDKYKMSKKELKELLQNELGGFLETQREPGCVEKFLNDLDEDGDGAVDFQEFMMLVSAFLIASNSFFSRKPELSSGP